MLPGPEVHVVPGRSAAVVASDLNVLRVLQEVFESGNELLLNTGGAELKAAARIALAGTPDMLHTRQDHPTVETGRKRSGEVWQGTGWRHLQPLAG
ncbi:ALF repeat-containing protein [Streptomyces sp. NBC_01431]|uniref:ALF repeat-containing protein n=1 Tax=Streptomyces sp. NBC_01431 TaxID=2903863 RepID=UPI003FCD842B